MYVSCWVCGLWYDNAGSDWQCPHTPTYTTTGIPLITPPSVTPATTTDPTPEEE